MAKSQEEKQAQARLSYLTDAGHLLATSAPGISSFLMTRRQALTAHLGLAMSEVENQAVCGACGNIMVPGCTGQLKFEADTFFKRKRQKPKLNPQGKKPRIERPGPFKVITCGKCDRATKIQLPPPPAVGRRKVDIPQASALMANQDPRPTKSSSNAASRKRAKARKAGLQGLLASSKVTSSNSKPALTLSSFMKK